MSFPALIGLLFLLQAAADPAAEGMKALEERRWDAAVASFTKALEADAKDYSHHFHLGFAQSMAGRDEEAVVSYKKALELKPGLYEAQLNLGIVLLNLRRPAEAVPLLTAAAEAKPKEFRPVYYAGEALLAAGETDRAIPMFQSAMEIYPQAQEPVAGLARAYARLKKVDEAATWYRKLGGEALLELAALYEAAGRSAEAVEIYKGFPDNAAARERMGELLLEGGKADEAIGALEAAVKSSPTAANRYALAMAYNTKKRYAEAEPLLAQVLAEQPGNFDIRMTYARVLREQKKYTPAAEQFFVVTKAKPEFAEAWSDLAGMFIMLEKWDGALAALDKVRALNAEKAAHHYFRAIILDRHKMREPALASYEKFLATSEGKNPDEEFKARQRIRIIKKELERR